MARRKAFIASIIVIIMAICGFYGSTLSYQRTKFFHYFRETHDNNFYNRYAILSVVMPDLRVNYAQDTCWQYVFYIPITVQAWWRLNVSSLIFITGVNVSETIWTKHRVFGEIYRLIKDVPGIKFAYLESTPNHKVMIAQTARIFASTLLPGIPKDTVLITTDIDLIPLSGKLCEYLPTQGVRLLNAYCCGTFKHNMKKYRMYPMSNIIATVSLWKNITARHVVRSVPDIIHALANYYKIPQKIVKGGNDGWFLDQHVVSILLVESSVKLEPVPRSMSTRIDRIHSNAWNIRKIGTNMEDAHMPLPGWKSPDRVKNLTHALFDNKYLLAELDKYIDMFNT